MPIFAKEGQGSSTCQIMSKSVNPLLRYWDFSIFQDGGRPLSWISLEHIWTTHGDIWWSSYHFAKFGYDRCSNFNEHLIVWLKNAYTSPKLGFWGYFTPKWAAISEKAKKAHPCVSPRHLSHQALKYGKRSDLSVGESLKKGINT